MSNAEILKKAIQKAIDGGFDPGPSMSTLNILSGEVEMLEPQQLFTKRMMQDLFFRYSLLFNHDFAKALWGEEKANYYVEYDWGEYEPIEWLEPIDCRSMEIYKWQYHLQHMVIADDPIKYLGENMEGKE